MKALALATTLLLACHLPSFAVVSTTNIDNASTGDGSTTAFPFTFAAQKTTDIQVYVGGVLQSSGYTVTINSNGVGGTVNFSVAPASSVALVFDRIVPLTQTTHLVPDGVLSPKVLEAAYDKLTMAAQQLAATTVQSITTGNGISNTGTATNPVLNNTGVNTISAGSNVTISGTPTNPIINSSGGGAGGVSQLIAGSNVTLSPSNGLGTVTVNATGGGSGTAYTSADQVITTNGTLSLTHGLGAIPATVVCALVCQSAEAGYSVGDLTYGVTAPSSGSLGSFVSNGTTITVNYGSGTKVFGILNKSTGAATDATNANWKLRVFASNVIISGGGGGGGGGVPGNTLGANQFANSISSSGIISGAQVAFSNLSGAASTSQLPVIDITHGGTNNGALSVTAGTVYYADGSKIVGLAPGSGVLRLNGSSAPTIVSAGSITTLTDQAISNAGLITLAHGLGAAPKIINYALVCQTAQNGYSIGDVVTDFPYGGSTNQGVSFTADSTNVYIVYGAITNPFSVHNKTTGSLATATNANWKLRVYVQ